MTAPTASAVAAPPAAVLWDMDGTLVDTEPYWMACEHELVAAHGGRWTDADARSIIGFDLLDAAVALRDRGGVALEPEEIVEHLLDGVIAKVSERVPWRPGARRLLSELNTEGVPCALVTMSWRRLVDAVIDALGPIRFQAVVTGDEVRHGKPHPEPYLRAAAALGVDPAQCVAIEDSPTGVRSAAGAGCVVVAVPNMVPIEPAPGRHVVRSLKGLTSGDLGQVLATTPLPADVPRAGRGPREQRPRTGILAAAALALVAAIPIGAALFGGGESGPVRVPGPLNVHAWTPYWALDEALPDLGARASTLHEVSPLWFQATSASSIETEANTPADKAEQFIDEARDRDVPVVASVVDGTAPGVMAGILADPTQRAQHVEALASFAADGGFDGLDIDYEQFAFSDGRETWATTRPNWVAFIDQLATRLHTDGRTLTVSVPPVFDGGQSDDSGFWVYDYAAITPLVDTIRVMAYDYSVASGPPGPIAPLPWVDRVIAGTSQASGDPSKLILGVPLYGRNWVVTTSGTCPASAEGTVGVTTRAAADLAARRGATPTFVPGDYEMTFSYDLTVADGTTSCTQSRDVRYVDANGAQIRIQHAVDAGFGGVALFALGYEDDATWQGIDRVAAQLQPAAAAGTAPSTG